MKLTYLGHSAFEIETNGKKILIDPFMVMSQNYNPLGVTDIFVTHGHSDHLGSAIDISRKTGAEITAIFELANYCASKGAKANGVNIGGVIKKSWGTVTVVPAFHSSVTPEGHYGGCPCGFIFNIEGKNIFHAGDTGLNSEMKVIGEVWKPEISMLPVGGYYTMDIGQSVIASKWLNSETIIPMHYNTFPAISVNIDDFKSKIIAEGKTPLVLKIGESKEF